MTLCVSCTPTNPAFGGETGASFPHVPLPVTLASTALSNCEASDFWRGVFSLTITREQLECDLIPFIPQSNRQGHDIAYNVIHDPVLASHLARSGGQPPTLPGSMDHGRWHHRSNGGDNTRDLSAPGRTPIRRTTAPRIGQPGPSLQSSPVPGRLRRGDTAARRPRRYLA